MVVALPKRHSAAGLQEIDLAMLKDDPFLLFPREVAPTVYDTVVDACRKAGFEPIIGQVARTSRRWSISWPQSLAYRSSRRR